MTRAKHPWHGPVAPRGADDVERLHNAIIAIDYVATTKIRDKGRREAIALLATKWLDYFNESLHLSLDPSTVDRLTKFFRWYVRAWTLVPELRNELVDPRDIAPSSWGGVLAQQAAAASQATADALIKSLREGAQGLGELASAGVDRALMIAAILGGFLILSRRFAR